MNNSNIDWNIWLYGNFQRILYTLDTFIMDQIHHRIKRKKSNDLQVFVKYQTKLKYFYLFRLKQLK